MNRWLSFFAAILCYAILHEGMHAVFASLFGEYDAFHIRPYGLEVTFNTPTAEREDFQWAMISGMSNLTTIQLRIRNEVLADEYDPRRPF